MPERIPVENPVGNSGKILGEKLFFPTAKRFAKNRFLKAAMSEALCHWDPSDPDSTGLPTDTLINLYEKWCAAGYGVVLTGNIPIDLNHLEGPGNMLVSKEVDSPERRRLFAEMASRAKSQGSEGSLLIPQITHAGRQTPIFINKKPFSSSSVQLENQFFGREFGEPVELSKDQIRKEIIDRFAFTSKFLFDSGFDGVQLHGAHGYLLAQFLSRTTNKRTDEYGGSPENRARIVVEIHEAIRKLVPPETGFVVGIKLNSVEFQNEGMTTDEAVEVAKILDEAGFDFIELSGGTYEFFIMRHVKESTRKREAFYFEFAKKIKPAVKKAIVYLTGGLRTAPAMVSAIEERVTDGLGLGRPSTQEFDTPKKMIFDNVQSCPLWPFDPENFLAGTPTCQIQMVQAGKKTLSESNNDVNDGLLDLSDPEVFELCAEAQKVHFGAVMEAAQRGEIKYGPIPYPPIS
ncbi:hypothetical protein FO519_004245 [Halicephalobus sp. NKZ332]|nr:hypothetical protein FO519_004245 [Halicephalobus sp. NKZ332]